MIENRYSEFQVNIFSNNRDIRRHIENSKSKKGHNFVKRNWRITSPTGMGCSTILAGPHSAIGRAPDSHLTRKSGVLGSIPGVATYFRFSFRFFKKGSCQLLAEVCARSTG